MLDIKNLTKEQAIEWHKKMWNFILENENKEGENLRINIKTRRELKETFLKEGREGGRKGGRKERRKQGREGRGETTQAVFLSSW